MVVKSIADIPFHELRAGMCVEAGVDTKDTGVIISISKKNKIITIQYDDSKMPWIYKHQEMTSVFLITNVFLELENKLKHLFIE